MLYGKMKTSDDYGFRFEGDEEMFESYVVIDDDEHWDLVQKANKENKMIVPDDKGYPTLIDRPPPKEEEIAKNKLFELTRYLNSTDWYVIRFVEEGIPIPTEVKEKRHQSRCEISKLCEIAKNNTML